MLVSAFALEEDNIRVDILFCDSTHAFIIQTNTRTSPFFFIRPHFTCLITTTRIKQSNSNNLVAPIDSISEIIFSFQYSILYFLQSFTLDLRMKHLFKSILQSNSLFRRIHIYLLFI